MTISRELAEFATGYGAGSFAVGRNRIINGDMRIDQRNAGAAQTVGYGYSLDRWQVEAPVGGKVDQQQNAGSVTPPSGFKNYLGCTSTSAYSVSSTDYFTVAQKIEGYNVADLAWGTADAKTVTLSFWVRSSLTGTFGGSLVNAAGNRSYPFTYTISSANTWEQKSVTIAGDTSGTWLTTNGNGLAVNFGLGVGSTYSGTAGAWAGAYYFSATGATSVVGTSGATFYITGVQLEEGTVATPFERRQYGQELALCQRYYETLPTLTGFSFSIIGAYRLASDYRTAWFFKVPKRASPTLTGTWIAGPSATYSSTDMASYFHTGDFYNSSTLTASAEL